MNGYLKASHDLDVLSRQLRAAAIAVALTQEPGGREICVGLILDRVKQLGIRGVNQKTLNDMIKSCGYSDKPGALSPSARIDPALLAHDFLARHRSRVNPASTDPNSRFLHYHNGTYYIWDKVWREVGPQEMTAWIVQDAQVHAAGTLITTALVGNIEINLRGLCLVGRGDEPLPFYIDDYGLPTQIRRRQLLPLANGMLDLDALAAGKAPELLPHDPRWFGTLKLPYDFEPNARCPKFKKFLHQVLERNPKDGKALEKGDRRLQVLQEWFGYSLLCDGRFQKFLLMLGEGSNGKGVIQNLWIKMLGRENVSHVSLDQFGERFGLYPLVNKLANICGDLNEIDSVAEGVLKRLTGEDNLTVDRKHKAALTLAPAVKLIFATNGLPRFKDRSQGIWRRLVAMPFRVVIPNGEQDEKLTRTLEAELPGILNWAVGGLQRLLKQGAFTQCSVCAALAAAHKLTCDPIAQFLDEGSLLRPETAKTAFRIEKAILYQRYREWCEQSGHKPFAKNKFGEAITKLPGVWERRVAGEVGGKRPRFWYGVGDPYRPPMPGYDSDEDEN